MSKIFNALQQNSTQFKEFLTDRFADDAPALNPSQPESPSNPLPSSSGSVPMQIPAAVESPIQPATARTANNLPLEGIRSVPIRVLQSAPLFPFDAGQNYPAEQYKIIRTKLQQHPQNPRLITVTSAGPADGKTVTAINLAASLSLRDDTAVLLVDGDFRHSTIHKQLGIPVSPGFTDVLAGDCKPEDAIIQAGEFARLYVLPAGTFRPNSVELLDSLRFETLCTSLRATFSHVIIDSTPVAAVAEYHLLQQACDGTIMVIRPDHTSRTLCTNALATIPKEKFLGVILNCVPKWFLGGTGHSDHSYYYTAPR